MDLKDLPERRDQELDIREQEYNQKVPGHKAPVDQQAVHIQVNLHLTIQLENLHKDQLLASQVEPHLKDNSRDDQHKDLL